MPANRAAPAFGRCLALLSEGRTVEFDYRHLGDYRILHIESGGRLWAARGYSVYYSDNLGQDLVLAARFPAPLFHAQATVSRPLLRLLRAEILGAMPLSDGSLLAVAYGRLLRAGAGERLLSTVLARPGKTMKLVVTPDGMIYAGEYFHNADRAPVNIFRSRDSGLTWELAYQFPAGAIRHVHALAVDAHRDGLLVLTGDTDHESKVLSATRDFASVQVLAEGSQRTRAMGIVPTSRGYYLPTDTPFQQNYVQLLSREGLLQPLCPIAGSCLAVGTAGNWSLFGTAVEPSTVNKDPCATLYGTPDGVQWFVISRWRADRWSGARSLQATLFQMARVILPSGDNRTGYLFATTMGTAGTDGALHRWRLA